METFLFLFYIPDKRPFLLYVVYFFLWLPGSGPRRSLALLGVGKGGEGVLC